MYNYSYQIPVLVQITNDGLMQSPVVFKNELKLEQYYILNPSYSLQTANNHISFLMGNSQNCKFILSPFLRNSEGRQFIYTPPKFEKKTEKLE